MDIPAQFIKKSHVVFGRSYDCLVTTSLEEANKFMEANREWSCLAEVGDEIYLAKLEDEGKPVK